MPRSQLIKFRLSTHAKERISRHAERFSQSVAAFMRDLTTEVIMGRSRSDAVRADMVAIRQMANALLACAERLRDKPTLTATLVETSKRLRDVTARHLGASA